MLRILVADKIAPPGLALLDASREVTYDVRLGLAPSELAAILGEYEGILIRSAVRITAEVLAKPGRLLAVARAGAGVDNVDVNAATAAGVVVLNTPDANTISTAEHAFAMMAALHRQIPAAHEHVRSGQWQRSAFQGTQLAGKTLGIIGLGRIGRAVAKRALAFEMNVLAYDPFVAEETALDGAVRLVPDLSALLRSVDCLTLHASLSEQTRHMIGATELALMKPKSRLVNCARGALVDEHALAEALNSGHLAGAAIDVFEQEPPLTSPLLTAKNVMVTPHLAASTSEAQERVSVEAVESILAYLTHGEVRSAVNLAHRPMHPTPALTQAADLCSRMGTILSAWGSSGITRVRVTMQGESLQDAARSLAVEALVAVLSPHLSERLNVVNAQEQARRRGIKLDSLSRSARAGQPESLALEIESKAGTHAVDGVVLDDGLPRIIAIDRYRMDVVPEGNMVLIFNEDRPGVIGLIGRAFGDAGINIADMALSRQDRQALMVLKLDAPMPVDLRDRLRAMNPPIRSIHTVTLPPVRRAES